MPKKLVVICGINRQSLKSIIVTAHSSGGIVALSMVSELTCNRALREWMGEPWAGI